MNTRSSAPLQIDGHRFCTLPWPLDSNCVFFRSARRNLLKLSSRFPHRILLGFPQDSPTSITRYEQRSVSVLPPRKEKDPVWHTHTHRLTHTKPTVLFYNTYTSSETHRPIILLKTTRGLRSRSACKTRTYRQADTQTHRHTETHTHTHFFLRSQAPP